MVTRERATRSKYLVPPPSSYVRYRESLPMLPDPVLQDYLKENLTFSENKALAKEWHNKSIRQGNMPRVAHQRIVGHVDGLDITESCLLEREETSWSVRGALRICVVYDHNVLKWDSACRELRVMYKTCLVLHADIVCGDGNQAWYFRSKAHKAERTDATGENSSRTSQWPSQHSGQVRSFPTESGTACL